MRLQNDTTKKMRATFISLAMIGLVLLGCPYTWAQSQENSLKYEVNGVVDVHSTMHRNMISTSTASSIQAPRSFGSFINMGVEAGVLYELKEKHFISGRLGVLLTLSGANLQFSPGIVMTSGAQLNTQSLIHSNTSIRLELGHQYLFFDQEFVLMSFNSGLGLRYWNWNQTSDITYYDVLVTSGDVPIGQNTSYSLRPLHPDLNLGLSLVFKDFFDHVDLSFSYSFLWAPFNAYRMDHVTFRDGSGFENQFQFDSRVNYNQFRLGLIFALNETNPIGEDPLQKSK